MADAKITALTALTTLLGTDIFPVVSDPGGTPVTKKITAANIAAYLAALTQTLTNKTLTSPKINENVALTTTATELNLLHNNLVGAAYTPSTSGLTLGNGTLVARKIQLGKLVFATIQFTLGSTSAIGTDARITLPVTEQSYPPSLGIARYNDVSAVRQYTGWWREGYLGVPGVDYGNITATFPFTWATGDTIYASIVYEAV
jgi:hypothetical protein